jgi:hypothetical protein
MNKNLLLAFAAFVLLLGVAVSGKPLVLTSTVHDTIQVVRTMVIPKRVDTVRVATVVPNAGAPAISRLDMFCQSDLGEAQTTHDSSVAWKGYGRLMKGYVGSCFRDASGVVRATGH